jgi:hypothetical protein
MLVYAVEAWVIPQDDDEEPAAEQEMYRSGEFRGKAEAMRWAWERMEEGFFVRLWRRDAV